MEKILQNYGRFLVLEDKIPEMERQIRSLTESLREMQVDMELKEITAKNLEEPGFFQRLLGRLDQKREKAVSQYREARASYEIVKRKKEELEFQLEQAKEEFQTLSGSREEYEREKGSPSRQEVFAFAPAAIGAAGRCIDALEEARPYARRDAHRTGVGLGNRKLEFLQEAEKNARRLAAILALMPEGIVELGGYLKCPEGYITGVTSEFAQLDRLEMAMNQVREVRKKLRELAQED